MQTEPDGYCLPRSVLLQIRHDPKYFNEKMLLRMIGLHLMKHPDIFYPYIKEDLGDQSHVSYCKNIYEGNVWGDDVMLAAIGHMWNISIMVVMPHSEPLHLFHDNYENLDTVIVLNGGPPESDRPATHFCATRSHLLNPKVLCAQGKVRVYDSFEFAKKVAENCKEERLKRTIFARLRSINFEIDDLEEQMADMTKRIKDAKKKRDMMEVDLEELGFNIKSLRSLRKNRSEEKYEPEGIEVETTPEYIPTYIPTPKEKEQEQKQQKQKQQEVKEKESEKVQTEKLTEKQTDEEAMVVDLTDPAKLLNIPVEEKREGPSTCIVEQFGMNPETFRKFVSPVLPSQPTTEQMEIEDSNPQPSTSHFSSSIPPLPTLPEFNPSENTLTGTVTVPDLSPQESVAASVTGVEESSIPIMDITIEQAIKSIFKENQRYVCPFVSCRKDYKYKSDCNKHVKLHFTQKAEYQCDRCGMKLSSANNLLEHTHGVHIKGDFLYNCKCGKGYYYKSHFSCHKQVCKSEKGKDEEDDKEGDKEGDITEIE